jgi:hypothetical protein
VLVREGPRAFFAQLWITDEPSQRAHQHDHDHAHAAPSPACAETSAK